jgi:plastocyanin
MTRGSLPLALVLAVVCVHGTAIAATVDVVVTDTNGNPAANAIVSLAPQNAALPAPSNIPNEAVIDQRNQMFVPLVVTIRKGGHVVFANNDATMHQVYSFSQIKQFEYEIKQGEKSPPVVFDKAGIAAIGCNIHDNMVAFVYVADSPWTVTTDEQGRAKLDHVPDGAYRATVWHPKLAPGRAPQQAVLRVAGDNAKLSLSAPLLGGAMPGMKHSHSQDY